MSMQAPQDKPFRLHTALPKQPGVLQLDCPILLIGSCFSGEVGSRLARRGFSVEVNPFGTLFNPLGIFELMSNPNAEYFEGLNVQREGRWVSYRLHSKVSGSSESELNSQISQKVAEVNALLLRCGLMIITFGTAWVWSLKGEGRSLSNLHKQPQNLFEQRLLGVEEIVEGFLAWYDRFRKMNPLAKVLLTVSPVIHGRAALHENNLSKSVLLLAAHAIGQQYAEVGYFPSYEIVRDELRDYRFYADDLQHPSPAAADYVTDCFLVSYADAETLKKAETALAESRRERHRDMGGEQG